MNNLSTFTASNQLHGPFILLTKMQFAHFVDSVFGKNSFIIRDGNGKAFGRAYHDDLGILAPLIQSCIIRTTTLKTLLR